MWVKEENFQFTRYNKNLVCIYFLEIDLTKGFHARIHDIWSSLYPGFFNLSISGDFSAFTMTMENWENEKIEKARVGNVSNVVNFGLKSFDEVYF